MKVKAFLKNLLTQLTDEGALEKETAAKFSDEVDKLEDGAGAADVASFAEAKDEIKRQAGIIAELQKGNREKAAEEFANKQIADKRALPTERKSIIAAFSQAQTDDEAHPAKVTFSEGDKTVEGSRVDALTAMFSARSAHKLFEEMVTDDLEGAKALFNKTETAQFGAEKEPDDKRVNALLDRTEVGKKAAAARK